VNTLSRTRDTLRYIVRCAPAPLCGSRALLLEQQLATRTAAAQVPGVLRQIVIAVRDLVGPAWLSAHAGEPSVMAFARLDCMPVAPPLPVLDEVLSSCLWARFLRPDPGSQLPRPRPAPPSENWRGLDRSAVPDRD
jgi:hypothetical protein